MPWTLIPAKPFHLSKQRLACVLSADERSALSAAMLARTIRAAKTAFGSEPVLVVSPGEEVSETALGAGADQIIVSTAKGLNAQLADAVRSVPQGEPLLVIHGDLPLVEPSDLEALMQQEAPIVIAPDQKGQGTNALLQRAPDRFFAFGEGSFEKHMHEAERRGLAVAVTRREGLACDLDDADDWRRISGPDGSIEGLLAKLL